MNWNISAEFDYYEIIRDVRVNDIIWEVLKKFILQCLEECTLYIDLKNEGSKGIAFVTSANWNQMLNGKHHKVELD